jgi:hypothetical protein
MKKRKCGIQPAHQSLFTDVFGSRSLLCTIHRVTHLHVSTREAKADSDCTNLSCISRLVASSI